MEEYLNDQKYITNMAKKYEFAANATQELYDRLGRLPDLFNPYNRQELTDVSPTVTTVCGCPCASSTILVKCSDYNIRRLTPLEYWRIMGFTDEQYKAAELAGISKNQLYKQAGNSIAVNAIYHIFCSLYSAMPELFENLRVTSLFSGIGAFEAGLTQLYKEKSLAMWQLVNYCEIDKAASTSYSAVHNVDQTLNLGDISKVDTGSLNDFDMLFGGSPCTDFSTIGKRAGVTWVCNDCGYKYNPLDCDYNKRDKCPECNSDNITKTHSSLLIEYLRVLRDKHPKVALYENVKNICGREFRASFDKFVFELEEYGYNVNYAVLNAKDYGWPQNRERLYMVLIDKDIDNGKFLFPTPCPLLKTLSDLIEPEENIDDSFYLTK